MRRRIRHHFKVAQLGWVVVCAIALLSSSAFAQKPKGRDITGTVVDVGGQPVGNATVAISGGGAQPATKTTTAADGTFKLAGAPTTNFTLDITGEGFEARHVTVIGAKTALQLQVVLVRPPPPPTAQTRMISGVVLGPDRAPVPNAVIKVRGTATQTVTAADGTFTLVGVTSDAVNLDIEAPGMTPNAVDVPVGKGAVVVELTGGAPIGPEQPPPPAARVVQGVVKETDTGEPLPGVTVAVTGTDIVAITDENGAYTLENLPHRPLQLEFSSYGHETRVADLAPDQLRVDTELALSAGEQIVIEGRAPVIVKQNLANGASVVQSADLNRVSAQTVEGALQGKLSGSNLQFNSGAPGGGAQIRLRGISTINGQSSPLFVVDGVIVSNVAVPNGANAITAAAAGGSASNQDNPVNRVADLNPNDIQTVEVLKGASAAALYGSQAANGVVIITTKRGTGGQNTVNVTQRFGVAQVSNRIGYRKFTSAQEVMDTFGPDIGPAMVEAYNASGGEAFDYESAIEQTKLATETIASAAGGTEKGSYYGSVLVRDEPGVVIGTYYEKQTARLALGYLLWDRVRLGVTANLIHSKSDRGLTNNDNTGTSYFIVLSGTPSFIDLHPQDGIYPRNPSPLIAAGTNVLQSVDLFKNEEDVWRLITGTNAALDVYKTPENTISLLGNVGVDSFTQKNELLSPPELTYEPADGLPGTSINAATTNLNFNLGSAVTWALTPKDGKFKNVLSGGLTYGSVDLDSVYVTAQSLIAGQPNVDSAASVQITETRLRTKDSGLYLQEEVALLDDRLSLLGGLLGERSSLNGNPDKYYVFPKVAAVYALEVPEDMLDLARVRAAYGEAGNRPNYGQRFTPLNAATTIDGAGGLGIIGTAGDPDIEPERQREIEAGVDAAAKDQRAVAELTVYQRSISNLLLQRALATSTGFTTAFLNGGGMRNRGIEAAVQVTPVTGTIDWTSRATFTLNRSTVTDLPFAGFDLTTVGFGAGLGAFRIEEGKSATQIVTSCTPDSPGCENGRRVVGNGEPDFRIGWSNAVKWKEFTFTGLIDWQQGSDVVNLTRLLYDANGVSPDVMAAQERFNAFAVDGDITPYIEDASFVKLREVSVTYDVPAKFTKQIGPLQTLQLSLQGRNLLTFTSYSGLDPEVSNFGNQAIGRNYDVAPYPPSRSFWLTISGGL